MVRRFPYISELTPFIFFSCELSCDTFFCKYCVMQDEKVFLCFVVLIVGIKEAQVLKKNIDFFRNLTDNENLSICCKLAGDLPSYLFA